MHVERLGRLLFVAAVLGLGLAAMPSTLAADAAALDVQADDYRFGLDSQHAVGTGHVVIKYQDTTLKADRVEVDNQTKAVSAQGNVVLQRGAFEWRGEQVTGNFQTREFVVGAYRAQTGVWYGRGESGRHLANGDVDLGAVTMSTCDRIDSPHYSLSARRVVYQPDGTFTAYHTVYRIGSLPVFYFPIVAGNTRGESGNIEIRPGYDSDWGAYLMLAKGWRLGQHVDTKVMLHLRSNRGVALGNRTQVHTSRSDTDLFAYGMYDSNPDETEEGYNRRFETEEERYRIRGYHRQDLAQELRLRLQVDALSDMSMLEEWFGHEYRAEPQAPTYADATWDHEHFSLGLTARPRVNDFYSEVERLPELRFDMPRQALWGSGLYYQEQTSLARLEMKWRDFDKDRPAGLTDPQDYDTVRFDTSHFLYYPLSLRDGIEFVPRAGARLTYYENTSDRPVTTADWNDILSVDDPDSPNSRVAVCDYDADGGSVWRAAGEAGFELSSKFYRVWDPYRVSWLYLDGLRHIVQPYVNYTYAPEPTEDRENLYFFDATDRLIGQNFVRVGLRQRWQTRHAEQVYTLARLENYADFHFADEDDHNDVPGDFATTFELRPDDLYRIWGMFLVDMAKGDLTRFELGNSLGDPKRLKVSASYLYRDEYDSRTARSMGSFLPDFAWSEPLARHFAHSHYLTLQLDFPMGAKTSGVVRYEFDLVEGDLARQMYEVRRDLHCWLGALRFEEEQGDLRLLLVLYLKAYPGVTIDAGI